MFIDFTETKIGVLKISASEKGISHIEVCDSINESLVNPSLHIKEAIRQIDLYFKGQLKEFKLELDYGVASDFYKKVWNHLLEIPFGKTESYLTIAKKIGDPNAVRAVGMANGKNPIAIVVPCHRVIGSNGSLTGYAYGLEIKRELLALENPKEYAINGSLF